MLSRGCSTRFAERSIRRQSGRLAQSVKSARRRWGDPLLDDEARNHADLARLGRAGPLTLAANWQSAEKWLAQAGSDVAGAR